jgi:endonuclease G
VNFRYLDPDELEEVVQAATAAGLTDQPRRDYLLSSIDRMVALNLNVIPVPQLQLRSDLVSLNGIERLADGSVPLQLWLRQASTLAAGRTEDAVFRRYQEKVAVEASGQPALPDPASLPEVINNEAIIHQDDMVAFGFLTQGAIAGISVAKLLVPRFDDGVQRFDATGRPVVSNGTGWLVSRDLVVTNHHVVNARRRNEANASDQDLAEQAAGTTVKFDFDSADANGTDVGVRQLEAWDPLQQLDFAILRLRAPMTDRSPLRLWPRRLTHVQGDYRPVNIIQHPEGNSKTVAFRNNLVTAADDSTVRYFTDTLVGSSGSPVFDDAWSVVALHRGSRDVENVQFQGRTTAAVNFGTQIAAILERLRAVNPVLLAEIVPAPAGGGG